MKKVNFFLNQMAFCKTYIPLIIEYNKRGYQSDVFIEPSRKYNCPMIEKNFKELESLSKAFNFNIRLVDESAKDAKGLMFVSGRYLIKDPIITRWENEVEWAKQKVEWKYDNFFNMKNLHVVVLTNCMDFENKNKGHIRYKELVNNIIINSEFYAKRYDTLSEKNLYFGNPRYDFILSKDEVLKKYQNILKNDEKYCLLILPKMRDFSSAFSHLSEATKNLRSRGYKVIAKSRGKDSYARMGNDLYNVCDYYFEDITWFTHPTMDFMTISDVVLNCCSTSIEEAVMLEKPVINFKVKSGDFLSHLYRDGYTRHIDVNKDFDLKYFNESFDYLTNNNLAEYFQQAKNEMMFVGNSSKTIADYLQQYQ